MDSIHTTIIAQCTPQGAGALALLRLSGQQAWDIAHAMSALPGNKKLLEQASHTVHYGYIVDGERQHIDQVMITLMRAPKTFTGEHVVEITCHNNPFIIQAIIETAIAHGACLAQPGEFTRRAYLNGKIDLLQAEAIHELITAQTHMALKKSLAQLEGSLSHVMLDLERQLVLALAWCEASFEFLDDEGDFSEQVLQKMRHILSIIEQSKKAFAMQQQIRQGVRIALIGSVNAGKSSLFNRFLGHQRAIVTPIAGTTRDSIEASVARAGAMWTLIDTAGIRETADIVEQEGIKRSFEAAHVADVLVVVCDASRALSVHEQKIYQEIVHQYPEKTIVVYNKVDIALSHTRSLFEGIQPIAVSSLTGEGFVALESKLHDTITALFDRAESPFLLNQRQYGLLLGLEHKLERIVPLLLRTDVVQYEIVSYLLKEALEHISELTGKSVSEASMDAVFKEFCVGK